MTKDVKFNAWPKAKLDMEKVSKYELLFMLKHDVFFESLKEFETAQILTLLEPLTFHTSSTRYKCDFIAITSEGRFLVIEVKGSKKQRGYHYSRARMSAAAAVFRIFDFIIVIPDPKKEPHEWPYEILK